MSPSQREIHPGSWAAPGIKHLARAPAAAGSSPPSGAASIAKTNSTRSASSRGTESNQPRRSSNSATTRRRESLRTHCGQRRRTCCNRSPLSSSPKWASTFDTVVLLQSVPCARVEGAAKPYRGTGRTTPNSRGRYAPVLRRIIRRFRRSRGRYGSRTKLLEVPFRLDPIPPWKVVETVPTRRGSCTRLRYFPDRSLFGRARGCSRCGPWPVVGRGSKRARIARDEDSEFARGRKLWYRSTLGLHDCRSPSLASRYERTRVSSCRMGAARLLRRRRRGSADREGEIDWLRRRDQLVVAWVLPSPDRPHFSRPARPLACTSLRGWAWSDRRVRCDGHRSSPTAEAPADQGEPR